MFSSTSIRTNQGLILISVCIMYPLFRSEAIKSHQCLYNVTRVHSQQEIGCSKVQLRSVISNMSILQLQDVYHCNYTPLSTVRLISFPLEKAADSGIHTQRYQLASDINCTLPQAMTPGGMVADKPLRRTPTPDILIAGNC